MKIRKGFVSNSSSSSFIVTEDLNDKGIACLKLNQQQKQLLNGFVTLGDEKIHLDVDKDLYLTQFISDGNERKWNELQKYEHTFYTEGQMNEQPRDERFYNQYTFDFNSVYLLKQHDTSQQMSINQFVKKYKQQDLPKQVLVKFTSDGVTLKYVY